jgi:hypothetical protein
MQEHKKGGGMIPIILTIPVIITGGIINNPPTHICLTLSDYLLTRLQKMQRIIIRNKFDVISEYNNSTVALIRDKKTGGYNNSTYRYEAETIHVKATHFYCTANIVYSDTSMKSSGVFFKELNRIIKVLHLPVIEMPKYINDGNEIIRDIVKIRMASNT